MTTGPENPYGEQQPPQPPPNPNPYYPGQQQPYEQQYQQPQYQQQPYGYPQQPYGYPAPPANHPSATTSMVLGIIGLAGIVTCGGITLVLSPFAWFIGAKASREIKASPGTYGGEGAASAGKIMGIIGTVLLILGVLAFVGLVAWAVTYDSSFDTSNSSSS